ncbi:MAG: hypothetical protein J7549_10455 [Variovorax sp.]|nr:hypothetical protein [Variovorax sp.]
MTTALITASTLVNHGLDVRGMLDPDPQDSLADVTTAPAAPADVLASFRQIALDPRVVATAPELASVIGTLGSTHDLASWAINAKYAELGSADSPLGRATGAVAAAGGNGFSRAFLSGVILWSAQTGAHALWGPIRTRWQELGAETGFLGYPTSDVTAGADVHGEGSFAHFQGGSIYWAPPSVFGGLVNVGVLSGAAVSAMTTAAAAPAPLAPAAASAVLTAQPAGGVSDSAARMAVRTALDANRLAENVNTGIVPPALDGSAISGTAIAGGVIADGALGGMVIDPVRVITASSAGAYEVHGAIREKYLALGAEASILGYPRTDETGTPDGRGRFNHFQGGSIYWTADTGAHEVHGLIRDRWSALGWERNPQLGYPLCDEMIPDRRVGHRRPETLKKPVLELPNGVIKVPAAAAAAGFPATVVNTLPAGAMAATAASTPAPAVALRSTAAAASALSRSASTGALGALAATPVTTGPALADRAVDTAAITATAADLTLADGALTHIDPNLLVTAIDPAILQATSPGSTEGPVRSLNRFADFESGVLFWFRGATAASVLNPLGAMADGTDISFTGADIAALAVAKIGRANLETANAALASASFVGTTGYSFDGVQVHNRRHRIQLILQGTENRTVSGPLGLPLPQTVAVNATIELLVEVFFDALNRRIALTAVDWSMQQAGSSAYAQTVQAFLRARLDPLLWTGFEVVTLPDTDNGAPIAVLSVKTQANGSVAVYVEPKQLRLVDQVGELATSVSPTVIQFATPPQP